MIGTINPIMSNKSTERTNNPKDKTVKNIAVFMLLKVPFMLVG